eukprot:338593-Rhodomonas_salina.2
MSRDQFKMSREFGATALAVRLRGRLFFPGPAKPGRDTVFLLRTIKAPPLLPYWGEPHAISQSREAREELGLEGHPLWGWHAPTDLVYSS